MNIDMKTLPRQRGLLVLSMSQIMNEPEKAMAVMGQVIVLAATRCFLTDTIRYQCLSPSFEYVPEGTKAPTYGAVFHAGKNGEPNRVKFTMIPGGWA
jgi:hypothetical protein